MDKLLFNALIFNAADIVECSDGSHSCTQVCNNTVGSYHCLCFNGYLLNEDGFTCTGEPLSLVPINEQKRQPFLLPCYNVDIDECRTGVDECEQNCHNNNGSYTCSCNAGYKLADDGFHCIGKILTINKKM
jgi:fibulin 1/2